MKQLTMNQVERVSGGVTMAGAISDGSAIIAGGAAIVAAVNVYNPVVSVPSGIIAATGAFDAAVFGAYNNNVCSSFPSAPLCGTVTIGGAGGSGAGGHGKDLYPSQQ